MNTGARGLTLIELMVVVALTGVLIVLVAPSMRGLISAQRVQSINAEIVTDLQFARSEAARRNRDVFVTFRAGDNCYVIHTETGGPGNCRCNRTPGVNVCTGAREEIKTVQLPPGNGVSVAASSATGPRIVFDPQSGISAPELFEVNVIGAERGQLRTLVNAAGRPSVCTPDGSITQAAPC